MRLAEEVVPIRNSSIQNSEIPTGRPVRITLLTRIRCPPQIFQDCFVLVRRIYMVVEGLPFMLPLWPSSREYQKTEENCLNSCERNCLHSVQNT